MKDCRQQTESKVSSGWRMAISSFPSKREALPSRYVNFTRLQVIATNVVGSQQGHAKGTNLPTVGQVEVSWYTAGQLEPASSAQPAPEMGGVATSAVVEKVALDEETVASGWGDNGEDGMGML